jgi:hypothetical protein
VFDEVNPGASTVVTNPVDMGTVPAAMDLTVMWSFDLGMPECNIALDCGDGIAVFVEDDSTFMEVFAAESLPITDTEVVVPAAALAGGPDFFLETETFNGVEATGILDGESDTYDSLFRYEDINGTSFVVPEPSLALVQVAALATLGCLARRRRKSA